MHRLIGVLLLGIITHEVWGQDSLDVHTEGQFPSVHKAIEVYNNLIGPQAMIFNGVKYIEFTTHSDGHPFYSTDEWENGSVWYEGHCYLQVPLLYDIVKDELVIEHFDQTGSVKIKVFQSKVSKFQFQGHTFVRMDGDTNRVYTKPGFYDLLSGGNTQLVAKRRKSMSEEVSQSGVKLYFYEKDRYFIVREGSYFQVKGKAAMLKALQDKKKALRQFIRSANLQFSDQKERDMIALVEFYNKN